MANASAITLTNIKIYVYTNSLIQSMIQVFFSLYSSCWRWFPESVNSHWVKFRDQLPLGEIIYFTFLLTHFQCEYDKQSNFFYIMLSVQMEHV